MPPPYNIDYTRMTLREFREFFPYKTGDDAEYQGRKVHVMSYPWLNSGDTPTLMIRSQDGDRLEVNARDVSKWREPRLERGLGRTPTTPTFEGIAIALDELHKKVDALAARVG